jgi:hypothetical protein
MTGGREAAEGLLSKREREGPRLATAGAPCLTAEQAQLLGRMFWLKRKTFAGSYLRFTSARRS